MLAAGVGTTLPAGIVVGRALSAYNTGSVQNNQVTITYTVYNEQATPETGVLLTTTLQPGVTFQSATQQPDRSGQDLSWSLGTISGFGRASVTLFVSLASPMPLQLDGGAHGYATLDAGAVSNSTPAATLRPGTVDASLLASTADANTTDPFIQEEAAKLSYDPTQIFNFLHTQVGYNSYTGSVRGARGTLWSSAGNALDAASLGIALMRASGIPAQYASGTLSEGQAQALILSMFPASYQTVGYIPAGTQTADPANDPKLLSESESHYWFQFDAGSGMKGADPLMTQATVGMTFTAATGTFAEVPDSLREKTEVKVNAELYSSADALFGLGGGLGTTTVLDHVFNDVELVGHPLSIGNFVSTSSAGFIFSATTTTFSPFIAVGDDANPDPTQDQVIRGQDYQQVVTSFPLGTQILTGLFLNVTLSGPEGPAQSYDRTLADRIGYAARQSGSGGSVNVTPSDPPLVGPLQVWSMSLLPGSQSTESAFAVENGLTNAFASISAQHAGNDSTLEVSAVRSVLIGQTRSYLASLLAVSALDTQRLAQGSLIAAYFDRPRITIISANTTGQGSQNAVVTFEADLRSDSIRTIVSPEQPDSASLAFQGARSAFEDQIETDVFPKPATTSGLIIQSTVSASIVFQAASAQGIALVSITPSQTALVNSLAVSVDAKARITTALEAGRSVVVPAKEVNIDGSARVAWYELNTQTGEAVGVGEDGAHFGLQEFAAVAGILATLISAPAILEGWGRIDAHTAFGLMVPNIYPVLSWAHGLTVEQSKKNAIKQVEREVAKAELISQSWGLIFGRAYRAQLEEDLTTYKTNLDRTLDPPIQPTLSSLPGTFNPPDHGLEATTVTANTPAGGLSGTTGVASVSMTGALQASWSGNSTSAFLVSALAAGAATVTGPGGSTVGSGAVSFNSAGVTASPIPVAVKGNANYSVNGVGSLAFYGPAESALGVSGNWDSYAATVTGSVSLTITTDGLSLNGAALPAGTYTITAASATLSGRGPSTSPDFAGSASLNATGATLALGIGGGLTLGGKSLSLANGATLTGYAGTITVSANGNGTDSITLNGTAANVLSLSPSIPAATTDSNTPTSFQANVLTSFADNYTVTAQAPIGWSVTVDTSARVTVQPAASSQGGTFPVWLLVKSATNPDLVARSVVNVTVTSTQPGLALSVATDPVFSVPFNNAQVPSGFRASIQNKGPVADTFSLTASNLPSGFTLLKSGAGVTVPAGQTGILGLYLQPNTGQTIPPPGTVLSFNVTSTSTTDATITETQTVTITVPAIDALIVTASNVSLNTTPGTSVTETLTITNAGNVPENNVALTSTLPGGLILTGLTPVSLQPGQSTTETVTLTPASSTPLNSHLVATITATYGPAAALLTQTLTIPVNVVVPGADAIANAATAAAKLGDSNLAARLGDLSTALTALVLNPADPVAKGQTLASIDAVTGLLGADPFLATALPGFASARAAITTAGTPTELIAAANTLGNALGSLDTILTDEPAHNFTLSLVNNSLVAQPLSPATFQLVLQNTGSQTTTYDLGISGLPSGVTAAFSQPSITLTPGQVTPGMIGVPQVIVTLNNSSTTDLSPFSFQVTATAEEAPEINRSTTGSLTTRRTLVQVVSVTTNPTFTQPGGKVDVSARILNAVNKEQEARIGYTVSDPTGTVIFTSQPVLTTLHVLTTLSTVDLGNLDTTGFAVGDDTINVTVTDATGTPISGATGKGSLMIGTPVTATLLTSPSTLPAGNGTVTTTLQLNSQTSPPSPLSLAGKAAVSGASGVAVDGNLAYVGTSGAIEVVNIADPTNPVVLSTFATGDFPSAAVVQLRVYNNELVVLASQFAGISNLLVYSLATPASPTLLGKTPLTLSSGNDQGIGLTSISNNHVYTGSAAYRYFVSSDVIFAQFGESLDINISDPTNPAVVNVIYNNPPSPSTVYPDGNSGYPDGTSNIWQSAAVNAQTLLIGTTTATMGTTNGPGVNGLVMVVDTTDPSNPSVLEKLAIPGMAVATGIVVHGNQAFVLGSSQYWGSGISGLAGNVVVATLDLTNPKSPTIVSTQTLGVPSVGIGGIQSLGNGQYLTSYNVNAHNQSNAPGLLLLDTSDPQNVVASIINVPAVVNSDVYTASGNLVFTADGSNLLIYTLGQANAIPVTAQVTVPINSVVPGSFNIAPTTIITGATTETLKWDLSFSAANTAATFTWQSAVPGLQPAETEIVAQGGTVSFVSQGTSGTLTLPAQSVTGDQIIGLSPTTQTVAPGAPASYTVNLLNPTNSPVTYTLSVQGVSPSWVSLAPTVNVPAGGSVNVPLTLTSNPFAAVSDYGFTVSAAGNNGASASVSGDLVLQGTAAAPDGHAHGIVLALSPTQASAGGGGTASYVVTLTNVGDATDAYSLVLAGPFIAGYHASFTSTSPDFTPSSGGSDPTMAVPPGEGNSRQVLLTINPPAGAASGNVPFTVSATLMSTPSVRSTALGTLIVLPKGVGLSLTPGNGASPGSTLQLLVTNTGKTSDTFDLTLAGPAALVSSLAASQVTLAPGQSQVVPVATMAADFAVAGALDLTVVASSHDNPAVKGDAVSRLTIAPTQGFTVQFSPASQTLSKPGTATFLLTVTNTGNTEDSYSATIIGTNGPVTATLVGLDGLPAPSIPIFRVPGLSTAIILVRADLSAVGSGTITVQVNSLTQGAAVNSSIATATLATPPVISGPPDGPEITAVRRYGIHWMPTTLVLSFNQPLDLAHAEDVNNYVIIDPHGRRVLIGLAVYDPAALTVTLHPARRLNFHYGYKLTVNGATRNGLANTEGLLLDGGHHGRPGGNYSTVLNRLNLVWPFATPKPKATTLHAHVPRGPRSLPRPAASQALGDTASHVKATKAHTSKAALRAAIPRSW